MTNRLGWGIRLAPLLVTQAFLWLTLALFASGPWDWPLRDSGTLFGFVIVAHLALLVGYLSAAHRPSSQAPSNHDFLRLLKLGLWATILVLPLTSFARTGQWIPTVGQALADPGKAYQNAQLLAEGGTNFASYLRILVAPILALLFPIGVFYWGQYGKAIRVLLVSSLGAVILISMAIGQRRDIADLLVTLPFLVVAAHVAGATRLRRSTLVAFAGVAAACVVGFTFYFAYSHVSRVGRESAEFGVNPVTMQLPDPDHPVLEFLPDEMRPGAIGLMNYLTSGYYGLSLALDREVQPMFGLGHSMFLTRNAARLVKDDSFEQRSLPVQISNKDGFTYPIFWCTAYPYFANDLGFLGVLAALAVLGRIYALSWIDTLGGKNPIGIVMFSLLTVMIFYLPATNRMLQDGEGVSAFYTILAIWLLYRWRQGASWKTN